MIEISFAFTEDALRREKQRPWKSLRNEEFFICFESKIQIADETGHRIILAESPLLGFCSELQRGCAELASENVFELSDFYGNYRLEIRRHGESVGIFKSSSNQMAFARLNDLTCAALSLGTRAVEAIEKEFPQVLENLVWTKARNTLCQ